MYKTVAFMKSVKCWISCTLTMSNHWSFLNTFYCWDSSPWNIFIKQMYSQPYDRWLTGMSKNIHLFHTKKRVLILYFDILILFTETSIYMFKSVNTVSDSQKCLNMFFSHFLQNRYCSTTQCTSCGTVLEPQRFPNSFPLSFVFASLYNTVYIRP